MNCTLNQGLFAQGCGHVSCPHREFQIVACRDKHIHLTENAQGYVLRAADGRPHLASRIVTTSPQTLDPGFRVPPMLWKDRLSTPGILSVSPSIYSDQSPHSQSGQSSQDLPAHCPQAKNRYRAPLEYL